MTVVINTTRKAVEIEWEPGDYQGEVKVYATGSEGDVHNTAAGPNDGLAALSYPMDFRGESSIEIKSVVDDLVIDQGTIEVGLLDRG
jgi:hypothetical protein